MRLSCAVDFHRLVRGATPAAQAPAPVAEGGDQADVALHRYALLGQRLDDVKGA